MRTARSPRTATKITLGHKVYFFSAAITLNDEKANASAAVNTDTNA